jgi:hypothetical protein
MEAKTGIFKDAFNYFYATGPECGYSATGDPGVAILDADDNLFDTSL